MHVYIFHGYETLMYHSWNSKSIFKKILNYLNCINFLFMWYEALITSSFFCISSTRKKSDTYRKNTLIYLRRFVLLYKQFHKAVAMSKIVLLRYMSICNYRRGVDCLGSKYYHTLRTSSYVLIFNEFYAFMQVLIPACNVKWYNFILHLNHVNFLLSLLRNLLLSFLLSILSCGK